MLRVRGEEGQGEEGRASATVVRMRVVWMSGRRIILFRGMARRRRGCGMWCSAERWSG